MGRGQETLLAQSLYENIRSFPRTNFTKECTERQLCSVSLFLNDVTTLIIAVNITMGLPVRDISHFFSIPLSSGVVLKLGPHIPCVPTHSSLNSDSPSSA